ncbi:MAG TPA: radical SAM family heme chaperone HemW [bacterium]|jgi:oxygen-independent coproporphyrinogen-3 oxidase|nr:radical SAM family heme chaperone HemW [bacterium]
MSRYVDALCAEIKSSNLQGPLQTIYFGGGTPSLLPPEKLELILHTLREKAGFLVSVEISMEANPETVDLTRLQSYRAFGVNRLSFGAQAFQTEILKKLGRGHDWARVEKAFSDARQAGFTNINLDLMFGLAGQSLAQFQESVQKVSELNPEHISMYALQVEEGTPLARQVDEGLELPSEDQVADEYAWAQTYLLSLGYEQYEVSNFSKPGKACQHNWNIWRGENYWGFGLSAVGTVGDVRHSHGEDLMTYIEKASQGYDALLEKEVLAEPVRAWEKIMLQFRTQEGVLESDVESYVRSQGGSSYKERFNRFENEGFISLVDGRYRSTAKGYFVLNGILETLMV